MEETRFDENPAKIQMSKTVNPDGSYTEIIEDFENKWAEIREYDAQGDLVRSTYGTFSDEPDVSDEEADDYIDFLLENEKGDEEKFQRWRMQRNEAEEEQNKAEQQRGKETQILSEVQRMIISCSSPPLVGTLEENARYLMKKIEYFRENGVAENRLYELECKIPLFMPDFVAEHFGEFYTFLKKDITSISLAVELLANKRDYAAAKKVADPLVDYLERYKEDLLDGYYCHSNSFETALYTLEEQREIPTWKAGNNYAAFFVTYAKILQNTRAIRNGREVLCIQDSRKYLDWVLELCPQNASAWLYKGISYTDDDEAGLECYKKALRYCYQAGGDYGLGKIYEHMGLYYLRKNQIDVAEALKTMSAALGGEPLALTFLLVKRQQPTRKPYQEVLRKHHIQIGFSQLVQDTADFLSDPRVGVEITPEVRDIISGINGLRIVYGQHESATGAQKTAWFFLQSIGCFLLLPAICFFSVPQVSRGTIPYAADILLRIENASFLIKAGINFCVGLLYILGLGILLFRDALREGAGERRKRNFTMVMLYFSAFVTAGIRFALLLQHGITAGFGVFLIVNIIVHLLFLWGTFSGFKDELEIHREVGQAE